MTIQITDWHDLDSLRNELGKRNVSAELTTDLTESSSGYDTLAGPTANDGRGWDPIGLPGFEGGSFKGELDGNGHFIQDVFIDRAGPAALFTRIFDGSVYDLGIVGNFSGDGNAAPLCTAAQDSTLERIAAAGRVESREENAGGVLTEISSDEVRDVYSTATVVADGVATGIGFFGTSANYGIERGYFVGSVNGRSDITAAITSEDASYDPDSFGNTFLRDCFYDDERVGDVDGTYDDGDVPDAAPLSTADMTGDSPPTTMSPFDFGSVWETVKASDSDAAVDGYPVLQALDRGTQIDAQQPAPSVTIKETSSPVNLETDNELAVTVGLSNNGPTHALADFTVTTEDDTKTVTDDILGAFIDRSEQVTLGVTTRGNFTTTTTFGGVSDSTSYAAVIPEFSVSVESTNSPVDGSDGGVLDVTSSVTNVGNASGERDITLTLSDESATDSTTLALSPDETSTVTLTTNPETPGQQTATVTAGDGSASTTIDVVDSNVAVRIVGANDPVGANETLELEVELTNAGGVTASDQLTLTIEEQA